MLKIFKNNLDEMQDLKLKSIEAKSFWVLYSVLFVTLFIQMIFLNNLTIIIGELILVLLSSAYVIISCIKANIWGRCITKPTIKSSFLASIISAVVAATITTLNIYINHDIISAISFVYTFMATFILAITIFAISNFFFKRKEKQIENGFEE